MLLVRDASDSWRYLEDEVLADLILRGEVSNHTPTRAPSRSPSVRPLEEALTVAHFKVVSQRLLQEVRLALAGNEKALGLDVLERCVSDLRKWRLGANSSRPLLVRVTWLSAWLLELLGFQTESIERYAEFIDRFGAAIGRSDNEEELSLLLLASNNRAVLMLRQGNSEGLKELVDAALKARLPGACLSLLNLVHTAWNRGTFEPLADTLSVCLREMNEEQREEWLPPELWRGPRAPAFSAQDDSSKSSTGTSGDREEETNVRRSILKALMDESQRLKFTRCLLHTAAQLSDEQADGLKLWSAHPLYLVAAPEPRRESQEGAKRHQRYAEAVSILTPPTDLVQFSVTAPATLACGGHYVVDVWAHLDEDHERVLELAREASGSQDTYVKTKLGVKVARGTSMVVRMTVSGLTVRDSEQQIEWLGAIVNASFPIAVPSTATQGTHPGTVMIFVSGVPLAKIPFVLTVGAEEQWQRYATVPARCYKSAFASYASQDRNEVLGRLQGMQKVMPNLDVFLDVVSLRSGQDWYERLMAEISRRDVFYLFWSKAASASPWVEREWRTALERKGIHFIDPVPLVSPEVIPPPSELAGQLHFNDWVLAYMRDA